MDAARWKRIEELFRGAIALADGDRERFLGGCNDDDARVEVMALLASAGGTAPLVDDSRPGDLVAFDVALDALAKIDERKARAVELRYFGGLTHAEIALVLGLHVNTVNRDLELALAWIRRQLSA